MTTPKHPRMGDALIVDYTTRQVSDHTYAAIAFCECYKKGYTAVSFSERSVKVLIERKHRRHLLTCSRQAELWALDNQNAPQ